MHPLVIMLSKVETKIREIDNDNIDLLIEIDRGLKLKFLK